MASSRYCGMCGAELVEGDRFCGHCGAPREAPVPGGAPETVDGPRSLGAVERLPRLWLAMMVLLVVFDFSMPEGFSPIFLGSYPLAFLTFAFVRPIPPLIAGGITLFTGLAHLAFFLWRFELSPAEVGLITAVCVVTAGVTSAVCAVRLSARAG